MSPSFVRTVWLSGVMLLPWQGSPAQKSRANVKATLSASVSGTVVDVTSGAAIAEAEILHLVDRRRVVSDSAGNYDFPNLPVGIVRLLVRGKGFPATLVAIALARDEKMSRVIELDSTTAGRKAAQALPVVAVEALNPPRPRYVDFERRRVIGRGQYVVREEIERAAFGSVQDAMRGLRGVVLDCGGGITCSIRMARAPMQCRPDYIVDERLDNTFGPSTAIRDIEGIEVYTGPSDVPGEFAGRTAGCGVIVIWTRVGPSRRKS